PLAKWFHDPKQASHPALRSWLRRSGGPLSRRRAWEWMSRPPFAAVAIERLARAESVAEHESVLRECYLIENPARANNVALIPVREAGRGGPLPDEAASAELSTSARRGLARLASGLRAPESIVVQMFSPMLTDPDPAVRLSAVTALPASAVLDF